MFSRKRLVPADQPLFTITREEILADLSYPGRPPGEWLGIRGAFDGEREPVAPAVSVLRRDAA